MKFSEYILAKGYGNNNYAINVFIHSNLDKLLEEYNSIEKKYLVVFDFDGFEHQTTINANSIEAAKTYFIKTHAKECVIKSITLK